LTVATITGTPTFDIIASAVKSFYGGQPTKNVIWDWSGSDPSQLTPLDLEQLAGLLVRYSVLREDGKTAMVAPDSVSYRISKEFRALGELNGLPFTVRVFFNRGDALLWISDPKNKP
jgi:hypothetical protein